MADGAHDGPRQFRSAPAPRDAVRIHQAEGRGLRPGRDIITFNNYDILAWGKEEAPKEPEQPYKNDPRFGTRGVNMTADDKFNEHLKLLANWGNTLATALIAAGFFVPAAQAFFHLLPATVDFGDIVAWGTVCIVMGLGLHLLGHLILEWLR